MTKINRDTLYQVDRLIEKICYVSTLTLDEIYIGIRKVDEEKMAALTESIGNILIARAALSDYED